MSTDNDPLRSWMEDALKRAMSNGNGAQRGEERSGWQEIERIVELLEAETKKVHALDIEKMEASFATQAAALNVIFNQFALAGGLRHCTFDSMRVALRAQAQCRATYRGLLELKTPRFAAADGRAKNSGEQNVESAKTSA